jgi:hypothetical protein
LKQHYELKQAFLGCWTTGVHVSPSKMCDKLRVTILCQRKEQTRSALQLCNFKNLTAGVWKQGRSSNDYLRSCAGVTSLTWTYSRLIGEVAVPGTVPSSILPHLRFAR